MKKIYFLLSAALLANVALAQQTIKIKTNHAGSEVKRTANTSAHKAGSPGYSPYQVTTTIVANNGYMAGQTFNINFSITNTNADAEYIDSLAFTFPSTFTVNSSPNATFPTADAGGGAEALNGVNGQTISWGINNNDQWGGIWANPTQTFDINVTVAPGTTGNQVVQYFASGDAFGSAPGDYADSVIIPEMMAFDAQLVGLTDIGVACGLTSTETITAFVKNFGYDTITNITATYIINGGTPVVENPTVTILPGDTLTYNFTTTANLSTPSMYNIWVGTTAAGDANLANDSASMMAENYTPQDVSTTPLTMGFEPGADSIALMHWGVQDVNGDGATWALINTFNHTGVRCLRKPGSATNDDDWVFSNCIDLQSSNTYRLEYWYKNYELTAPCSLECYLGSDADAAAMTQMIVQNPIPTDTSYKQVVMLFTVSATGTYNMGWHAYASAGTSSLRIDDINLTVSPVGVAENSTKNVGIYPNPATNNLFVNVASAAKAELFNVIGEKVMNANLKAGINNMDISTLAEGSYIVRILNGSEVVTKKIVVSK